LATLCRVLDVSLATLLDEVSGEFTRSQSAPLVLTSNLEIGGIRSDGDQAGAGGAVLLAA
ncbi:MAG: hypothetical protein RI885_1260, partial [Actinomycetota bacterium]